MKVVSQDRLYLAFLAISCAGFSSLAAREFVALGSRDRRSASTAIKECATMLDLRDADAKEKEAPAEGSAKSAAESSSASGASSTSKTASSTTTSTSSQPAKSRSGARKKGKGRSA